MGRPLPANLSYLYFNFHHYFYFFNFLTKDVFLFFSSLFLSLFVWALKSFTTDNYVLPF